MAFLKNVLLCMCCLSVAVSRSQMVVDGSLEDEAQMGDASPLANLSGDESVANEAPDTAYHYKVQANEPESESTSDYGDLWAGDEATDTTSESDGDTNSDAATDTTSDEDDCLYDYYEYDDTETSDSSEADYGNVGEAQVTTNEAPQL